MTLDQTFSLLYLISLSTKPKAVGLLWLCNRVKSLSRLMKLHTSKATTFFSMSSTYK